MAKRPTLTDISSGYTSNTTLNDNFDSIKEAFDNTLSRNGSTPNQMESDLDMNSNDILNAKDGTFTGTLSVAGVDINDILGGVGPGTVFNSTNRFDGDGTTTVFTLTKDPVSRANTQVYINGVYQQKNTYSVSGTSLTFTSAPPSGTQNIEVNLQESTSTGTPSASGVSTSDGEDVQAKFDQAHYTSRASFVSDISAGKKWGDGDIVSDGSVSYIKATGATAISDMLGWLPFGRIEPEHLGDTSGDATAALVAWGSYAGVGKKAARRSYTMTGPVDLAGGVYDATGATFTYSSTPVVEGAMFTSSGSVKWFGGEIDGSQKVSKGFDVTGKFEISGAEIHGFRSESSISYAVGSSGASGGDVAGCHIYDVFSLGDGSTGDGNGPSRAVYKTHTSGLSEAFNIRDNVIHDIWGEEGDAIQYLLFDGVTYPFESAAWSVISGNIIYGVSRRCLKVQASDVVFRNNDADTEGGTPPAPPLAANKIHCVSVISSNRCIVQGNRLASGPDFEAVNVAKAASPTDLVGITVSYNEITADNAETAVFLDGVSGSVISSNVFNGSGRAIAMSSCAGFVVSGNTFRDAVRVGTSPEIRVTSNCNNGVITNNKSVSGDKYAMIQNDAQSTVVKENMVLRTLGDFAVIMSSASDDSLVSGTVSALATGQALSSPLSDVRNGDAVSLTTTTVGNASGIFWANSDPTTARATRPHARGDIALNSGSGSNVGWRCTVSGTPGTWVSFS